MQNRRIKNLPYQKYIIPKFHMFLIFRKRYLLQKKQNWVWRLSSSQQCRFEKMSGRILSIFIQKKVAVTFAKRVSFADNTMNGPLIQTLYYVERVSQNTERKSISRRPFLSYRNISRPHQLFCHPLPLVSLNTVQGTAQTPRFAEDCVYFLMGCCQGLLIRACCWLTQGYCEFFKLW